jgi:sulfur carrier protein
MEVEVRLFATFRRGRWKNKYFEFEREISIGDILKQLDIEEKELGIALVNGKNCEIETSLKDGDILALFPPIGGG